MDVRRRHLLVLGQLDRVEEVGEQQPVDDEARAVGHLDGALAEHAGQRVCPRAGLPVGALGEGQLDELHPRHRVEHVEGDEALRAPARLGQRRQRQRRRGRRQDRGGIEPPLQAPEELPLGGEVLGDRLDDEGHLRDALGEVCGDADATGVERRVELGADLAHGGLGPLGGGVGPGPQRHRALTRGDGGQAAGDGAAADDAESLAAGIAHAPLGRS
jgi:hypothetical protein